MVPPIDPHFTLKFCAPLHLPLAKQQLHSTLKSRIFETEMSQCCNVGKPDFPLVGTNFVFSTEEEDQENDDNEAEASADAKH